jgi:hypothetical protein
MATKRIAKLDDYELRLESISDARESAIARYEFPGVAGAELDRAAAAVGGDGAGLVDRALQRLRVLDHHHRDHHSSTAHGTAGEPGEGKQPGHVPKLHFQQLHACFYMRRCAEANT